MNDIQKLFKSLRLRATPQRQAVFESLINSRSHLTADEIYNKIKKTVPGLSLATVYTSLLQLKEKGLVSLLRIHPERIYYEAKKEPHHHLFCRKCGKIIDLCLSPCRAWKKKAVAGHRIEDLHGYFYGICCDCRTGRKV